ncbi:MAG TPA: LCP family protein, partial [Chthonomonadales bacterium]|nr:LCP family protein [Chthonomonadales bacterium]
NLHVDLHPGYQHLDGYEAMGYVRMRHSDSDVHRSERQHTFLEAVRTRLQHPATFLRLPKAADTLVDSLRTHNLTRDQMYTLANFARGLPREAIVLETLPTSGGRSFVSVDPALAAETIRRLFFPNQMVALGVDLPDPAVVRSLNGRDTRAGRRRGDARPETPVAPETAPAAETAPDMAPLEEPGADMGEPLPEPPPEDEPPAPAQNGGSGADTQAPAPL